MICFALLFQSNDTELKAVLIDKLRGLFCLGSDTQA